ncbi:AraC family transcriptional regulator [Rhodococcus pyridinivorans]|nr:MULTISPECIES: AraC family transcriptional regulator ligand-binding domain-containing protein [Rhodococcus]MCD2118242.1 AraC family transcriptional regulator [Rhodococcus pyridinivorans]MCW3472781.1 AraC family transcriptional regulator [Rhodococcus pyridinivorans]MCZ4627113.1 AraC family transcriptional regulator ligand-binding domain-containing protein [Rhodococcus pyridinivorans]MCZ4648349.1 AraC family transcriptional regulator ligand-binding domain-containing protein [Rhodococcus pyridin
MTSRGHRNTVVPKRASIRAAVHGIFGYALMSCATVRDGIEVGTRFFDLTFAFSRAALEYAGDEVRFCLDDRHVPAQLRGFLLERDVPGILAHWGALWGQPSEIRRIEVAESLGERIAPVFRDRGFLVKTTASTHAVVVDARALDRPMPTTSPEAAAVLLRECAELLQRRQNHGELGARVREVLLRRAAEGPTQDQVAETLGEEGGLVPGDRGRDAGGRWRGSCWMRACRWRGWRTVWATPMRRASRWRSSGGPAGRRVGEDGRDARSEATAGPVRELLEIF